MKLLCKLPIEPFLLLRFNTANNIIHQWTSWNSLLTHSTHSICFNSQAYTKTRSNQLITPCLCCALNHSHCDWVSLNWTKLPHTGILGTTSTCVNHYHNYWEMLAWMETNIQCSMALQFLLFTKTDTIPFGLSQDHDKWAWFCEIDIDLLHDNGILQKVFKHDFMTYLWNFWI